MEEQTLAQPTKKLTPKKDSFMFKKLSGRRRPPCTLRGRDREKDAKIAKAGQCGGPGGAIRSPKNDQHGGRGHRESKKKSQRKKELEQEMLQKNLKKER